MATNNQIPYVPLDTSHDAHPVRVWDVETKKVIGEFPTIKDCALFLGLNNGHVHSLMSRKSRNKTNRLGKTITIRPFNPSIEGNK